MSDAIRAWIQKGAHDRWNGHHPNCSTHKPDGCDCYAQKYQPALDALDELEADRDRLRRALVEIEQTEGMYDGIVSDLRHIARAALAGADA